MVTKLKEAFLDELKTGHSWMECLGPAVQYARSRLQSGASESAVIEEFSNFGIMRSGVDTILRLAKSSDSASASYTNNISDDVEAERLRIHRANQKAPVVDELRTALNQLIRCVGVREEIPSNAFASFLRREDTQGCVQLIATKLGLPVRISLSYVSEDSKTRGTERFRTTALVRTGSSGRGTEGVVAEVDIPQDLPMYGTQALKDYTVPVRISRNICKYPSTLVTLLAHELSHILLVSLFHPNKDSELHTDLVPIVSGFHGIVRRGRKRIRTTERNGVETTHTTTYGYLTDSQFEYACEYVTNIVNGHQGRKTLLNALLVNTRHKLRTVTSGLARFQVYLRYVDTHPPARMNQEESQKIVQCHALDYTDRWEAMITETDTSVREAGELVASLNHYTSKGVDKLERYLKSLQMASQELDPMMQRIKAHIIVLGGYVPLLLRIRMWVGKQPVKRFLLAIMRLYS